ncbi:MAG: CinA family protein [Alphaproteobacteria bacterium]|nr:CinA family protein [Alphaproteobacteria bacterium]
MFSGEVVKLATHVLEAARERNLKLSTAESCTGGLIGSALTDIAGSSDVVDCGFITYSNEAKNQMIDVPMDVIDQHGAVSREVASLMAKGALKNSRADISIAVTGVAGPGASENKPAGLVYIAIGAKHLAQPLVTENHFEGNRRDVRAGTLKTALFLALSVIQDNK